MFENPRRGRQARNFTSECSEDSRSQIVFRTDVFRKLMLGVPALSGLTVLTQGSNKCKRENWSDMTTVWCVSFGRNTHIRLPSHLTFIWSFKLANLADGYAHASINCFLKGL